MNSWLVTQSLSYPETARNNPSSSRAQRVGSRHAKHELPSPDASVNLTGRLPPASRSTRRGRRRGPGSASSSGGAEGVGRSVIVSSWALTSGAPFARRSPRMGLGPRMYDAGLGSLLRTARAGWWERRRCEAGAWHRGRHHPAVGGLKVTGAAVCGATRMPRKAGEDQGHSAPPQLLINFLLCAPGSGIRLRRHDVETFIVSTSKRLNIYADPRSRSHFCVAG